jgi:UDP-3-O-[3-hydroxymyristoyl] glucosamine N-acyltransferase
VAVSGAARFDGMSTPHFMPASPGLTVEEIAKLTDASPQREAALDRRITGVAPLDRAGPRDLSFFDRATHAAEASVTDAGACLTTERLAAHVPEHVGLLLVKQPYRAFVEVASKLFPASLRPSSLFEASGAVPGTFVHRTARMEAGVRLDPGVVIGARAEIGAGTVIAAAAVIGPDVRIGRDCVIGANATITHALIGDRVIIHPGARLGQDGFGFVLGPAGHRKVPQLGRVILQDDVEIGANTTIDRGGLRDTVIGEGTKIDNLVQIGHNVTVGRHCVVVGGCGISGSVTIGDHVILGGGVGIADHLTIGEGSQLGAGSGVITDLPPGSKTFGYPAQPMRTFFREFATLKRLAEETRIARKSNLANDRGGTDSTT